MTDTNANSILAKSLEESLTRLFSLYQDEVTPNELSSISLLINRMIPNKKCEGFYFDESLYKDVLVIPVYSEIEQIGKYLFDFEDRDIFYEPKSYIVCVSPKMEYKTIKEVVAKILFGIDCITVNKYLFQNIKSTILNKALNSDMIIGKRVFTFKDGTSYNISCTPLILPLILNVFELKIKYSNPSKLLNYIMGIDSDKTLEYNIIKYGYTSDYPNTDFTDMDKEAKEVEMNKIINNTFINVLDYPNNKGKMMTYYKFIIDNKTAGVYEKHLAETCYNILNKSNSALIDKKVAEAGLQESVKSFLETKKKGYSGLELDELRVEFESMTDSSDKMYLITRIHKDMNAALKAKSKLKGDADKLQVEEFMTELKGILKMIQDKKVKDGVDDIRITVQYPKNDFEYRD